MNIKFNGSLQSSTTATIPNTTMSANMQMQLLLRNNIAVTILAVYSAISTATNALLISAFIATEQVGINSSNLLIVCTSVSDLISSLIGMPAHILGWYNRSFNVLATLVLWTTFPVSQFLTQLLAIDRYLHMNPNVDHEAKLNKVFKRPFVFILIALVIAFSLFLTLLFNFWDKDSHSFGILLLCGNMITIIAIFLVTGLYAKGYLRIQHFTDDSPVYRNEDGGTNRPKYVRDLFKTVLLLIIAVIIAHSTSAILNVIYGTYVLLNKLIPQQLSLATGYAFLWSFSGCCFNCLIIFYHNQLARRWVVNKLWRHCFIASRERHDCVHK